MHSGSIIQTASPEQLYEAPATRYVADFIGESNLFNGTVRQVQGNSAVLRTEQGIELSSPLTPNGTTLSANTEGCIAVRPELIDIAAKGGLQGRDVTLDGCVEDRIYLGNITEYRVRTQPFGIVCVRVPRQQGSGGQGTVDPSGFEHGAAVQVGWNNASGLAMAL
jgi:spermidine/putrescine transport system ATP-binding protein